jgi:hypothetical protein
LEKINNKTTWTQTEVISGEISNDWSII